VTLDDWDKVLSAIEHGATVLALVVGGWWALHRFVLNRENAWNLVVDVVPTFYPNGADTCLLCASISLRNVGKVMVSPLGDGCWFSLRSYSPGLQLGATPHWNEGHPIVEKLAVISRANPNHNDEMDPVADNYNIEPGGEFVETVIVVVPRGILLMVEVGFAAAPDGWAVWTYRVCQSPV
jgi:hypothetical protein